MNDTLMTIVGNVVDTPKLRKTKTGDHVVANFRIASTPRRFDRERNAWVDATTLFVAVTAWRALGENVAQSLFKGQPVIVTGRYFQREYTVDEQLRTTYELEATSIGHDLSRGTASFERVVRASAARVELDADGIPEDHSDRYLDVVEIDDRDGSGDVPPGVDPVTGEVRELEPVA